RGSRPSMARSTSGRMASHSRAGSSRNRRGRSTIGVLLAGAAGRVWHVARLAGVAAFGAVCGGEDVGALVAEEVADEHDVAVAVLLAVEWHGGARGLGGDEHDRPVAVGADA